MTRIDQEMAKRGLTRSRSEAQDYITRGLVLLNNKSITKSSLQVGLADDITLIKTNRFVGRGGEKLERALKRWDIDFTGKVVIDVGASTGGFTDCALQHGARLVYAVDVGKHQLDKTLQADARVVSMESTDIRSIITLPEKPEYAVIDVSFISLTLILERVADLLTPQGEIIALIKPQFEVGAEIARKRSGVIKKEAERKLAIDGVLHKAKEIGLTVGGQIESPIEGGDGNHEFLVWLKK